jgi:hypothetical protein
MATFYLALAVAIVALATIVLLAVLWWRRRASARHAAVVDAVPATPGDTALPASDDVTLGIPDEAGDAQPVDMRFAPPDEPVAAIPDDAAPRAAAVTRETTIDPTRPTKVTFHLLLPTQGHARSAGQIARREGYVADVRPPGAGSPNWLCLLSRQMTPTPEEIEVERASLAELAGGFGGQLDRWEIEA